MEDMEKGKYYTPEIEEFHVGFEYEEFTPQHQGDCETYEKQVCSQTGLTGITKSWKYFTDYRVKYLDKEDIESLGWKHEGGKLDGKTSQIYGKPLKMKHRDDNYVQLVYNHERNNWGCIATGNINETGLMESTRFAGTINNKSELKRLMKQLKIEE